MPKLPMALIFIILCLLLTTTVLADSEPIATDTAYYELDLKLEVFGDRLDRSQVPFSFEKDRFHDVLQREGIHLIRKGAFFAQDIYVQGFKREDVEVVVDGERYGCACPNRMDSPLSRTNPLEIESIEIEECATGTQCGIGGCICYHRESTKKELQLRSGISSTFGAVSSQDVAFAATSTHQRITGRFARGGGYQNGSGLCFTDLYDFASIRDYTFGEGAVTGAAGEITYRAELMYTGDVMFPYLQMDERTNRLFGVSLGYGDHKVYFNHSDHTMDNGLRAGSMKMNSDAFNQTLGVVGPNYEVFARRWDVVNEMLMMTGGLQNHMVPDIREYVANFSRQLQRKQWSFALRGGLHHYHVGDAARLPFYAPLYGTVAANRTILTAGAGVQRTWILTNSLLAAASIDFALAEPRPNQLYLAVTRMMGKPSWSGNPHLKPAKRLHLAGELEYHALNLEVYGSELRDYTEMARATVQGRQYQTYANVDAVLVGFNLKGNWQHFEFDAAYCWAKNRSRNSPLAEVAPLRLSATAKLPIAGFCENYLRVVYSDAQSRIDPVLQETATDAWTRVDIGSSIRLGIVNLSLHVENLTDESYYQHLSYSRAPFSSGSPVFEPGRTVRMGLSYELDRSEA